MKLRWALVLMLSVFLLGFGLGCSDDDDDDDDGNNPAGPGGDIMGLWLLVDVVETGPAIASPPGFYSTVNFHSSSRYTFYMASEEGADDGFSVEHGYSFAGNVMTAWALDYPEETWDITVTINGNTMVWVDEYPGGSYTETFQKQ